MYEFMTIVIHICTNMYTFIHTHTHTHTYIYIYLYIHNDTCMLLLS